MKRLLLAALAALTLFVSAAPCFAQDDQPILSKTRLSAGFSADYCGYQNAAEQPLPKFAKSWEVGMVASYVLVAPAPGASGPILSLAAATSYDVDNKWFRHRVGLRLVVFKGGKY